jgi:hypothetical protein
MGEKKFFKIEVNEDGEVQIRGYVHREDLLKELDERYESGEDLKFKSFLDKKDPQYWGDEKILIIQGDIVVPKAKNVVTKFDID